MNLRRAKLVGTDQPSEPFPAPSKGSCSSDSRRVGLSSISWWRNRKVARHSEGPEQKIGNLEVAIKILELAETVAVAPNSGGGSRWSFLVKDSATLFNMPDAADKG
ncbi:hypothetical protein pipiens_017218 [Culex pipiens pipiens]|uniref:Uncharacterized protein n=1 Tax=Culex pipiens pipiens TaxID=38569 RepID=A0ABD1CHL3_CULPP